MRDDRHALLHAAANPRHATPADAPQLSRLFAAAFLNDPVMNWVAREGPARAEGLERFFHWIVAVRAIPIRRGVDGGRWQRGCGVVAAGHSGKSRRAD
jgi:hypothetical protein